ncbi:NAD(P)H-dependent oxidoreductase subunit E [Candidatus Woesearchaeota archaeon]|nr:NAD(P)H-dependent oxidoreductase subunit E [Candidatus Woesearchaeota archaeon]
MVVLLNVLKEAQEKQGCLSEDVLKEISIRHNVPLTRLYSIASFYAMLHTKPAGKHIIEICSSPSCILNNGKTIEENLEKELGIRAGQTTEDNRFSLYKTSCLGLCDEAPAMLVDGRPFTRLDEEKIKNIIAELREG